MNIHGIDLKPLDPDKAAALQNEMDERMSGPIRGGFIPPPVAGCHHEWELFPVVGWTCKKCHVLGAPPDGAQAQAAANSKDEIRVRKQLLCRARLAVDVAQKHGGESARGWAQSVVDSLVSDCEAAFPEEDWLT
jgi:hypothetical protein